MNLQRSATLKLFFFTSFFAISTLFLNAKIKLSPIFTDNMVLQQQTDVAIWGTAEPMKEVTVFTSWNKKMYKTSSSSTGAWRITMKTSKAGGPYAISVSDGEVTSLNDVMLGEVWICSGQSNMEMPVLGSWRGVLNHEKEVKESDYPDIRLFEVGKDMSNIPLNDIKDNKGGWKKCSPETVGDFSAVAYFFGRNLHKDLNIPIGLINTSWGGTPAQSWASSEALLQFSAYREEVDVIMKDSEEEQILFFERKKKDWEHKLQDADLVSGEGNEIITKADFDDRDWSKMKHPSYWEEAGLPDFDGVVWFRKIVDIPSQWANKELILSLGGIDDNDITYFNGEKIGETNGFNIQRKYTIPAHLVKEGRVAIAIRVDDGSGYGGLNGGEAMSLNVEDGKNDQSISLAGEWKFKVIIDWDKFPIAPKSPQGNSNRPSVLFNAMIHPLTSFSVKGAIWYQGESNADRYFQTTEYQDLFTTLIQDWRMRWNRDFSFYYVQLANFKDQNNMPEESNWPYLREAQLKTLHLQQTGMAIAIDIGEAYDIHPKNKQDVGLRLALLAMENTYGKNIISSGPIFKGYVVGRDRIRVRFTNAEGLKAKNAAKLKGFTIAGADHKFYWADATIENDEIVISSSDVRYPVAVRYAWANNPDCNLYNGADLPASPFRTDTWIK